MLKQPDCSCRPQGERCACVPVCAPCKDSRPPCCCGHPSDCRCPMCCPRPICPPDECRCDQCRRDCCSPCSCGKPCRSFLLPRIIASGRTWLRRHCCTMRVEGIECAQPPLTLLCVSACGEPSWEQLSCDSRQLRLRVTIPLTAQVRDACSCVHTGRACVEAEVCLSLSVPQGECWRSNLLLTPCVRLVCLPCTSQNACFDVQLEILIEAFLVRWETCNAGGQKPQCPDLPLYPQPCME